MRTPLRALALVLAVTMTAPLVTYSPAALAADDKAKARATFNEGVQLEAAGNYADALRKFQEVVQVAATPTVRFHIAFCQEKLGRLVEALGGYRLAAHEAESDGKSAKVADTANEALAALEKRIPKLTIKRGKGAEMAKISLDGNELGSTASDKPQHVDPGSHEVTATASGKEPFSQIVKLGEGESKTVDVSLKSKAAAVVEDEPKKDERPEEKKDDRVKVDQDSSAMPYIALGAGGVMLLASGYFYTRRNAARSELEDQCIRNVCPESAKGTQDRGKSAATMSTVTLGLGVIGVGVGTYLLLSGGKAPEAPKPEARSRRVDVGVGPLPGGLAAAVSGRFLPMKTNFRSLSLLLPLAVTWVACTFPENEFNDDKYERLKHGSTAGSSAAGSSGSATAGTGGNGKAGSSATAGAGGDPTGGAGGEPAGGDPTGGAGGEPGGAGGNNPAGSGGTASGGAGASAGTGGSAAGTGGSAAGTGGTGAAGGGTMNGPCTGNNQCSGGQICSNINMQTEKITCQNPNPSAAGELGAPCSGNLDCKSKFCDLAGSGTCLSGCNSSADCTAGSRCAQYLTATPFMLCMKPCKKNEDCPPNAGGTKTCMLHEDTLNDDFALTCDFLGATPSQNPKVKTFPAVMAAGDGCDTNVNLTTTKGSVTTSYCSKACEGDGDCGGSVLPVCQAINATKPSGNGTTAFKACVPAG